MHRFVRALVAAASFAALGAAAQSAPEISNCVGTWIAPASCTTRSAVSYRASRMLIEIGRAISGSAFSVANAAWSRVSYAAHDDLIALSATTAVVGGALIADIEIVRVEPGDRLRGRFSEAEAVGGHNL